MIIDDKGKIFDDRRIENKKVNVEKRENKQVKQKIKLNKKSCSN